MVYIGTESLRLPWVAALLFHRLASWGGVVVDQFLITSNPILSTSLHSKEMHWPQSMQHSMGDFQLLEF